MSKFQTASSHGTLIILTSPKGLHTIEPVFHESVDDKSRFDFSLEDSELHRRVPNSYLFIYFSVFLYL